MDPAIEMNDANIAFAERLEERKLRLRCLELSMEHIRRANESLARNMRHQEPSPSVQFVDEDAWVAAADVLFQYITNGQKIPAKQVESKSEIDWERPQLVRHKLASSFVVRVKKVEGQNNPRYFYGSVEVERKDGDVAITSITYPFNREDFVYHGEIQKISANNAKT